MVANSRLAGTTPISMRMLESSSSSIRATSKALAKFTHCGSAGQDSPGG